MAPVVVWIIVALLTAVVVLVVAGAVSARGGGPRSFVADLRSGLRRDGRRGLISGLREEMAEVDDVETGSVEDIFAVGHPAEQDYLRAGDLVQQLGRSSGRSRDPVQLSRR